MVPGPFNNLRVLYSLRLDTSEKYGIIISENGNDRALSSEEMDYTVDVLYMSLIDLYHLLIIL